MRWIDCILRFFGLGASKEAPKVVVHPSFADTAVVEAHREPSKIPDFAAEKQHFDSSKHWWHCPEAPTPFVPQFDQINNLQVFESLSGKLAHGNFSMIEIPQNIMRAVQVMNNPNFDYSEVVSLVSRSPMMAGEFIRIINSALYNRGVDVSSLSIALPRLGRENVKAILFLYSSRNTLSGVPAFNDVAKDVVDHCYAVGAISRYLSQRYFPDPDLAFMAGLLHDIGKVAILKELSDSFDIPQIHFALCEDSFDKIFPALHSEVGRICAEYWKLPESICGAIALHHDFVDHPFDESSEITWYLSALVSFSDMLAKILGKGKFLSGVDIFHHPACALLNIERNPDTIRFLDPIPGLFHTREAEEKAEAKAQGRGGDAGKSDSASDTHGHRHH